MKITKHIIIICLIFSFSSCNKWLEIRPEDKFTKKQVYANTAGVMEILNGFYLKMGENALYGNHLTLTSMDVLAQRYAVKSDVSPFRNMSEYKFAEKNVKTVFADYWIKMYAIIANINDFVKTLPTVENGMTNDEKNILIAEAIGLRAFLHFDLLRIFGPIYSEENKTLDAIPYVTELSTTIRPFLNSELVISQILADIEKSNEFLQYDELRSKSNPLKLENHRFNYFALKALQARVHLWAGDRVNALSAAQEVIDAQDIFPWITHQAITSNGSNPDRKFMTEVIFSVFNKELYNIQRSTFDANLLESDLLATGAGNIINQIYENLESDYRFSYSWPYASTGVGYRTFVKYQDITDTKITSRFMVPLIRMSEMYYIAAESTYDETQALAYLNTVRQHRNILGEISDPTQFRNELTKEYLKEFYGEGQIWFYYKRNAMPSIFSVNTSNLKQDIPLNYYQPGIPDEELNGR
ncbi:RagB/SusD family nutrient uptake outer membrane protein [Sphingobacterium sp. HJSM2_6]|uniref:RagB/SusD family nutrient uptake outer membrane protein n=1 Tax=Sphingobacterium sp. HJSM2_6 TaxID=3366264 RepID=UPI003BE41435